MPDEFGTPCFKGLTLLEETEIGYGTGEIYCTEDRICMLDCCLGLIVWFLFIQGGSLSSYVIICEERS